MLCTARTMLQGSLLTEINAAGNALITAYTVDGYVSETRLCQKALGADNDVVPLFNFSRSSDGRILSQASGNGLTEDYQYNQRNPAWDSAHHPSYSWHPERSAL